REVVQGLEAVEAHRDPVEIEDGTVRRVDAFAGDPHARLREPGRPAVHGMERGVTCMIPPEQRCAPFPPKGANALGRPCGAHRSITVALLIAGAAGDRSRPAEGTA